jgi:hypothetical protein
VKACVMGSSAWSLLTIRSSISSACTYERSLFIHYTQSAAVKCFIVYLYHYKLGHQLSWLTGLCCFQVVFINLVSCLFSTDRTLRLNGWYSCFVFGKSRVQISTRRPLCWLIFMCFSVRSVKIPGKCLKVGHDHFVSYHFQFVTV